MTKYETKVLQPEPKTYNMTFPASTCGITEIKVYPHYDQIAFITQKAIDSLLTFVSSEEA